MVSRKYLGIQYLIREYSGSIAETSSRPGEPLSAVDMREASPEKCCFRQTPDAPPLPFLHVGAAFLDAYCLEAKPGCSGLQNIFFNSGVAFSSQQLATAVNGTERTRFKANAIGRNTGCQTSRHGFLPAQFGRSTTFQYAGMMGLVHDGFGIEGADLRELEGTYTVQITCSNLARHSGLTFKVH